MKAIKLCKTIKLYQSVTRRPLRQTVSALLLSLVLSACGNPYPAVTEAATEQPYGVLLMAHGGSAEWNAAVEEAVRPLQAYYPVAIAFGMADAGSLERAVRSLEAQGVKEAGVVRLFVSGESWYQRTQEILGLREGAPDKAMAMGHATSRPAPAMPMGYWQIQSDLTFHLSRDGLADASEMDDVLLQRIQALSHDPGNEVVVVLAHGPGDDAENERWINKISARTELARSEPGLREIRVFTLREDWEEKRMAAEAAIRAYVEKAGNAGRDVLVIPYRVQGFGPYHEVLAGLEYRADEVGLVPHPQVNAWIASQAEGLRR